MKIKSILFTLLIASSVVFLSTEKVAAQPEQTQAFEQFKELKTEHLFDARVEIAGMIMVGDSKYGTRRVIPITGGSFEGPKIKGEVLPGGEDWQLVRPDGDTELYARYLLKTSDGVVIQVTNRVLMHMPKAGEKPASFFKSVIDFEAPNNSPYDYLNHGIFLGTLEMPRSKPGDKPAVVIGVYQVL